MGGCVGRFINQNKWILLSDHDRTDCTRWLHTNTINSKRAAYTSTVNQGSDNFMVALNTLAFTHGSSVCHRIRQQISKNVPKPIYTIKSLLNWCYTPYSWHLVYLPLSKQTGQQPAFFFFFWTPDFFSLTNTAQSLRSLMICPLMELHCWSDVTQNLSQTLFPLTMLQTEYILPLVPHCPLHFLPKLRGSRFNFCIDLVQKRAKKSDQSSTKSFSLTQSKYMNKLLVP